VTYVALTLCFKLSSFFYIDPDNDVKLSSCNLRDDTRYDDTSSTDQKHGKREEEMDGVFRNSIMTIRHDAESTDKGSNGETIKDAGKTTKTNTQKIQWLESLVVFCSNVSVVGLRYVVNTSASPYRRTIWFLLILFGVAFTTYHLHDRIRRFVSYPVNVAPTHQHLAQTTDRPAHWVLQRFGNTQD